MDKAAQLLDDVRGFIARFCVFPSQAALDAVTLWVVHAHMVQHFHTTPRLALLSPEPESGKTRVLEVLDLLTPEPMLVFSPSVATIFRSLAQCQITLLFDEVNTIFPIRGKNDQYQDLRGLLNSGYKKGATIPRCVGPTHDVRRFPTFAAVALAGIGHLPDTIMSRAVIIRMRRRSARERVEPFRSRLHQEAGHALRDRLSEWANEVGEKAGNAWPVLPVGVEDRRAEIWEPLIAVADQAGGDWPDTARTASVELCAQAAERPISLGRRLLTDPKTVFADDDKLATVEILERLCGEKPYGLDQKGEPLCIDDDAPWGDLRGKPLDS